MPRFVLEGLQPCKSFVLDSFTMHELRSQNVSIGLSSSDRSKQLLCFLRGEGQEEREQKHRTKNFVRFHNHSPLLTLYKLKASVGWIILLCKKVLGCIYNNNYNKRYFHWTNKNVFLEGCILIEVGAWLPEITREPYLCQNT